MDGIREKFWSEEAKQMYMLIGAAAAPLFVVSTLVGTATKISSFVTGIRATGYLSAGLIGLGAGYGTAYAHRDNATAGAVFTYFIAGMLIIDGALFSLSHLFPDKLAPFVAGLNGSIAIGTLVGAPLGGIGVVALAEFSKATD